MASPLTTCGNPTPTPTVTNTATETATPTNTSTASSTPISTGPLSVLINEIAWAGTSPNRTSDEWIELYNTESVGVNLNGWRLTIDTGNGEGNLATFGTNDNIPPGGFFLLARAANIFTNITVDKTFSTTLPNDGAVVLRLYNAQDSLIDTANLSKGSGWHTGTGSPTYASMERRGKVLDGASAWLTFSGTPIARNRDDSPVQGTPKASNWSLTVTPTPARTATATRTPTPTVTPLPPSINARLIINEILVRPGFDWNRDGRADVYDEFIEIKNLSPINVDLNGWRLDDQAVGGVNPFSLPNITLKPGEHAVFYRTQTNIPLSDGGGTVRLLNPRGLVYDEFTYIIAKQANRSFCRIPDGSFSALSWQEDCIPTPNLPNTREGTAPTTPGGGVELPNCG
ncbi:MAG TPA: lamin tail domain-containing protein, partial [Anaerolineales bacterium]|nr:lamin tail domain-containing protein [Anaerolineales bacterium]